MNFLEAVQSLMDGKCNGIKRLLWNRRVFTLDSGCLYDRHDSCFAFDHLGSENILADDWQLVEPIPQTETREVKVYASVDSTNGRVWSMGTKEQMDIAVSPAPSNLIKVVELTGTYDVETKPKVKRREEIIVRCGDYQEPKSREYRSFTGLEKIYREWEE